MVHSFTESLHKMKKRPESVPIMQILNRFLQRTMRQKKKTTCKTAWGVRIFVAVVVLGCISGQIYVLSDQQKRMELYEQMKKEVTFQEIPILMKEMEYFPVRKDPDRKIEYYYENGYGGERTYGGRRKHEGIDIMSSKDQAGCLTIQSVSDGVIEQMGWLPLGGYRIGIRSSSGFYYYYAHLEAYAVHLKKGMRVSAGDVLGKMGNTGYGKEGTRGKFAVHLHFGIYHQVAGKEKSLNPYYLLQYCSQEAKER